METNPTRMCELLVGLPEATVLGVEDVAGRPSVVPDLWRSSVDEGPAGVVLVDLPCFGRPARLVWHKHPWCCRATGCPAGSWTDVDGRIAASRAALTDRAGRWSTMQSGRLGRSVNEVAGELGCDWHTVMNAVAAYGEALLEADVDRVGHVDALGLDETLFFRQGPRHLKQ